MSSRSRNIVLLSCWRRVRTGWSSQCRLSHRLHLSLPAPSSLTSVSTVMLQEDKDHDPSDEVHPSKGLTLAQQRQFDLVSFRVSWSQAILFGCYEVSLIN